MYLSSRKYIKRLITEWNKHSNIIIGVDFDDTVRGWSFVSNKYNKTLDLLKLAQVYGALIVPFTARHKDNWGEIEELFKEEGIPIQAINKTPSIMDLHDYGKESKIYANIFLDDRGGLDQALYILKAALKKRIKFENKRMARLQQWKLY